MKAFKAYFITWLSGSVFNTLLLILICNGLGFDHKSSVCVYLYGIPGFIIKSLVFFLPYWILYHTCKTNSNILNKLLIWLPLILFMIWYSIIIQFQIESLYTDLAFGYIARLPHFIVQLFSALIICIITTFIIEINRDY